MPELPEVEVIARGLDVALAGEEIMGLDVLWPGSLDRLPPDQMAEAVVGRRITHVWRRGKYLVLDLLGGGHVMVHLRMTGKLCVFPADTPAAHHDRVIWHLGSGRNLHFNDTRKFGRVYLVRRVEEIAGLLGPEPLSGDFSSDSLYHLLRQRRGRIKPLLMNQRLIAGLGNIYVDEALFLARLHPLRLAHTLTQEDCGRLYEAIRSVLADSIARRGTTMNDYRDAQGEPGRNQDYLWVYGRAGQPCNRCRTPIERIVVSQRSTHYCPQCQPAPCLLITGRLAPGSTSHPFPEGKRP